MVRPFRQILRLRSDHWGLSSSPVDDVDDVAKILLVGDAVGGFGGEFGFRLEMGRERGKQFDAVGGFEFIATDQGMQGESSFAGRNALAQPGNKVRELPQRIEFAGEQLVQVRFENSRLADDDCISGDVAEPLAFGMKPASGSSDGIEEGQHIDETEKVASDDLVELKAQTFGIDNPQAKESFADGLAAPAPFASDAVADADDEIRNNGEGRAETGTNETEQGQK